MAKKPAKPEVVEQSNEPVVVPVAEATPAPATEVAVEPKAIDLTTLAVQTAITRGKALITEGKSKADAAREIYAAIKDESKEVIVAAFVEGATLTPKGALTYWYNNRRKASKEPKQG
jgi:hypothetical protein